MTASQLIYQIFNTLYLRAALHPHRTLQFQAHEIRLLSVHQMFGVKLIINVFWHYVGLLFTGSKIENDFCFLLGNQVWVFEGV